MKNKKRQINEPLSSWTRNNPFAVLPKRTFLFSFPSASHGQPYSTIFARNALGSLVTGEFCSGFNFARNGSSSGWLA